MATFPLFLLCLFLLPLPSPPAGSFLGSFLCLWFLPPQIAALLKDGGRGLPDLAMYAGLRPRVAAHGLPGLQRRHDPVDLPLEDDREPL